MPLDGNLSLFDAAGIIAPLDPPPAPPDLTKPSLPALAYLLRHPEARTGRASRMTWDYRRSLRVGEEVGGVQCPAGCALGLAILTWDLLPEMPPDGWIAVLGPNTAELSRRLLFFRLFSDGFMSDDCHRITPDIVADRIDDHLAGREIRYIVAGDRD